MKRDVESTSFLNVFARASRAVLTYRYLPVAAATLAIAITLPSLEVGWLIDDHYQRWIIMRSSAYQDVLLSPTDMWIFCDGDEQRNQLMMDTGLIPWWTYRGLHWAFWRPLATLTHVLDYSFWPSRPELMHAQSLLWFGALVACTGLLYRRFTGIAAAAGLATVLFAIDDAHGRAVGLLCNRNIVLASLFGVLALLAHHGWRRDNRRIGAALGPILLAMSLLSAEAGVAIFGYLLAYELVLDSKPWRQRLTGMIPYVLVVLVWRVLWRYQGCGVDGVEIYMDPVADPLRFVMMIFLRAPILLLGQWAMPPADLSLFAPETTYWIYPCAVILLILLAVSFFPLVRRNRVAGFWALGMLLATIVPCASSPANRYLFFIGIGAMGLLSEYLTWVFGGGQPVDRSAIRRISTVALTTAFVLIHLIIAPLGLHVSSKWPVGPKHILASYHQLPGMDASVEKRDLVILNHPVPIHPLFMLGARAVEGRPLPRRTRTLASALSSLVIHRPDARTLVILDSNGYLNWYFDRLLRNGDYPMAVGELVELTGMTVEIVELTDDDRPSKVLFRFSVPLEDPSLRWIQWRDGAFRPFVPPAVGQAVVVPANKLGPMPTVL